MIIKYSFFRKLPLTKDNTSVLLAEHSTATSIFFFLNMGNGLRFSWGVIKPGGKEIIIALQIFETKKG